MQGIDKTNKSIPYIQRETYWCVFKKNDLKQTGSGT